ncbi:MAG: signal transduction protein [Thermoproteota archaeon]|nr:MAG: signal transduction protein [Candidatus Korarchaeota archaeon]
MKIEEIMNRNVICLKPKMTLKEAAEIFAKNNINGAPVVNDSKRLLGILTIKDILKFIKGRMESIGIYVFPTPFDFMDILPVEIPVEHRDVIKEIARVRIDEVMEKRVHYVYKDTDVYDALNLLVKKGISRLPVVDENKKVIGIVTRSDILRALALKSNKVSQ